MCLNTRIKLDGMISKSVAEYDQNEILICSKTLEKQNTVSVCVLDYPGGLVDFKFWEFLILPNNLAPLLLRSHRVGPCFILLGVPHVI